MNSGIEHTSSGIVLRIVGLTRDRQFVTPKPEVDGCQRPRLPTAKLGGSAEDPQSLPPPPEVTFGKIDPKSGLFLGSNRRSYPDCPP